MSIVKGTLVTPHVCRCDYDYRAHGHVVNVGEGSQAICNETLMTYADLSAVEKQAIFAGWSKQPGKKHFCPMHTQRLRERMSGVNPMNWKG